MQVTGTLKESDYIAAQYLHIRPRPILAIFGILLTALFIFALIIKPSWTIGGAIAYFVIWIFIILPWQAKKNYKQYKALSKPVSIQVREDGIFFTQQNGEALIPWSHIMKWRHNKKLLLLYPTSNLFHIVPSHFFPTADSYIEFLNIIKKQIGNPS